ncbi:SMP-30/gluconolactonase/LRE family protein [Sphingobium sufflavum]|uniref:SMP-30/gluconolactonase/LRE family protein n=1 Tax=Sphingobium sufflavum TaxID=1129547 RepID=UPI001F1B8D29|nr:SMP-30/gluconolactonase/LRE family protein [Sphingobium sufflavum]MCE7796414.1 SMP-30/gluconolactonase/LRE family protein [Sphingobium sufflavum]
MKELALGDYAKVAEGVYLEGLCYDFGRDVIWYSDVIKGGICGVRPDGTPFGSFNEGRMWTGGVMMNADGAVLSSGPGGIMWNNLDTGQSGWLIRELDGKPINGINEMWPDGTGGIFFGTNDIEMVVAAQPTRPTALYRLTVAGEVIRLAEDIVFSNGIAFDAARRAFYCSDTFNVAWAWDVADDLSLTGRRILLDKDDCDGLALDAEGHVWITGFRSSGFLTRVTPQGDVLPPVETPPGCTTQVRFGGADLRDIYINVVPADGGDSLKEGKPLTGSSCLYRGRSAVPGIAVAPARFPLEQMSAAIG